MPDPRYPSLRKIQAPEEWSADFFNRFQDQLGETLQQVLTNPVLSAPDFRWLEVAGASGATPTWALQYRTGSPTPQTWATIVSSDADGDWSTAINLDLLTATGDMIYASAPGVAARLPVGSSGQVLEVSGGLPSWQNASGGGSASRTFATDANDLLVYHLDETGSPWLNSGSAGTNSLVLASGSVIDPQPGLFPAAGGAIGYGQHFRNTATDRAIGAAGVEPTFPITISCWWNPTTVSTVNDLFMKYYRPDGTWTTPFISVNLDVNSGVFEFKIAVSGAQIVLASSSTRDPTAIAGLWHFIVGTYDGTNMRLYVNGQESVNSPKAQTGAIDYGTHGPWGTEDSTGSTNKKQGILDECRVANVIRNAAWVASYWQTAMLLT